MTQPFLSQADAMPLREALRGLRFLLRRGGETVAETLPLDTLPEPASDFAKTVLREIEDLARSADTAAASAAKQVFGGARTSAAALEELARHGTADREFAQAVYRALVAVLERLGAGSAFVSELTARTTFAAWRQGLPDGDPRHRAADLTLRLIDARVIRAAQADRSRRAALLQPEPVAVFAVLLWLQSSRSDGENDAALEAAADIAVARAAEIAGTIGTRRLDGIAALYRKYVDHV